MHWGALKLRLRDQAENLCINNTNVILDFTKEKWGFAMNEWRISKVGPKGRIVDSQMEKARWGDGGATGNCALRFAMERSRDAQNCD